MPGHSVPGNKPTSALKRGGASLLFLCVVSASAHAQGRATDPAQAQFELGVRAMFAGDQAVAMSTFENLFKKTGSLRVKLEWARAAFLAKQYKLADQLFHEVLAQDIPDSVRFNISLMLTEIAKLGDQTDYGFTLVRDTNPFAVAKQQVILVYGIPFNYQPPQKPETLSGLNFYVNHSRSINTAGTVRLLAEADDTEYEGGASKSSAKLALQLKRKLEDNLSLRLGVDHHFQRRELLLRQPNLSLQYRKDQLGGLLNQYQFDVGASQSKFPDFAYADGQTIFGAASASKMLGSSLQVGANVYLDDMASKTRSLGYETLAAGVYGRFFTPSISSNMRLSYTQSKRRFKQVDELFVVTRQDHRNLVSMSVQPYSIKLFGLYPALEMGLEESKSNIAVNSFERTFFNVLLRKNY